MQGPYAVAISGKTASILFFNVAALDGSTSNFHAASGGDAFSVLGSAATMMNGAGRVGIGRTS